MQVCLGNLLSALLFLAAFCDMKFKANQSVYLMYIMLLTGFFDLKERVH